MLLAALLGGVIGIERETHGRPAGLRTHILVSMGAALFTLVSNSYGGPQSDPSRIASQIVSGIGFLGAGTIIRQGSIVRGLTTAASLWATAAIGMAASIGGTLAYLAIVSSIIVFVTLSVITKVEHALVGRRETRDLSVTLKDGRSAVATLVEALTRLGASIQGLRTEEIAPGSIIAGIRLKIPPDRDTGSINAELAKLPDVTAIDWE